MHQRKWYHFWCSPYQYYMSLFFFTVWDNFCTLNEDHTKVNELDYKQTCRSSIQHMMTVMSADLVCLWLFTSAKDVEVSRLQLELLSQLIEGRKGRWGGRKGPWWEKGRRTGESQSTAISWVGPEMEERMFNLYIIILNWFRQTALPSCAAYIRSWLVVYKLQFVCAHQN